MDIFVQNVSFFKKKNMKVVKLMNSKVFDVF